MADQARQSAPASRPAPASHANPHADELLAGEHASMEDHGGDHGHDDHNMGEGHGGEALGPIDRMAWGAAVIGIVLGVVVLLAFVQALT